MNLNHSFRIALLFLISGFGVAFPRGFKPFPPHNHQADTPSEDSIPRVGEAGVTPPVFLHKEQPKYPEQASKITQQLYVIVEAVFRKDGTIDAIKILRGYSKGKYGFEEATIEAVKKWRFSPGLINGEPADIRVTLKFDFNHRST